MTIDEFKDAFVGLCRIMAEPAFLKDNDCTIPDFCSVPEYSTAALLFYYWNLFPVNEEILKYAMQYASDEKFDEINEIISELWLIKADAEIDAIIEKMEKSSSDESL